MNTLPHAPKGAIVGSCLITANPFTLGHVSLIRRSLECCDFLYVFVVQAEHFEYSFSIRLEMVSDFLRNQSRCCVIPSGDIWGSQDLFPDYFNRNSANNQITITPEDALIFGKFIAPTLGITMRFIGEEKNDNTTSQYNEYLKSELPKYGISVIQFEREKAENGKDIEAKTVRKIIASTGVTDKSLQHYLPKSTIEIIKRLKQ